MSLNQLRLDVYESNQLRFDTNESNQLRFDTNESNQMRLDMHEFNQQLFPLQTSDNQLTSSAASQCLNQLSSFIGPNIMKGRVEQYDPRYMSVFFIMPQTKLLESDWIDPGHMTP